MTMKALGDRIIEYNNYSNGTVLMGGIFLNVGHVNLIASRPEGRANSVQSG
jgi:hypothetical protein